MKGEISLPFTDGDAPIERSRRLSRPITVSLIVLSLLSCSYFFSHHGSHHFGRSHHHHGGEHGHHHECEEFWGPPPPHFDGPPPPPPFDGHFPPPPPPPGFHHHGHEDGMSPPPPFDGASHWHMPPPPPRPWWKFWGPPPPPPHGHHHGHKKHIHCRDMQLIGDEQDNAEQVCAFDFISEKEECNVYVFGLVGKSTFEAAILSESEACQVYGYDESVDKFGEAVPSDSDRAHIITLEDNQDAVLSAVLATAEGKFIDILKVDLSDNADLMELDKYLSSLLEQRQKAHHHKKPEEHRQKPEHHDEPEDEDKKPKRPYPPPPPPHERKPHHPPHHGPRLPFGQLLLTADSSLDVKPVLKKISKLGMASFFAGKTASGDALEFDFMAPPPPPPHHRPHHGHHEPKPEDPSPEEFEQEAPMHDLV